METYGHAAGGGSQVSVKLGGRPELQTQSGYRVQRKGNLQASRYHQVLIKDLNRPNHQAKEQILAPPRLESRVKDRG